jgi:Tfp pilus assembly protein PilN
LPWGSKKDVHSTQEQAHKKLMVLMFGLSLAVGIALGVIGGRVLNAQQEPVKRTVLL